MIPPWEAKGATRREFIKGAAAAGAAIAALPALSGKASASTLPPVSGPGSMRPWQQSMPIYSGSVNLSSGNAQLVLPICGWGGLGGGLQFSLVFNSQSGRTSPVGPKWTHSYRWLIVASAIGNNGTRQAGTQVQQVNQSVTVITDDGTELFYTGTFGGYIAPTGIYDTLTKTGSGWKLQRKGGSFYLFNTSGQLTSITDLAGNVTTLVYSGVLLSTITDSASRQMTLGYVSGVLTSITDCVGRVWSLAPNASSNLQTISDPLLNGVSYSRVIGYDASGNVNALTDRLNKTWNYAYSSNVFLNTTDPDTHSWSLAYAALDAAIGWPGTAAVQANWTNANSKVTKFAFDSSGRSVGSYSATLNLSTFAWNSSYNKTDQWTPSGAHTQWGYDSRGNVTLLTDPFGKQTIKTYDYNNGDKLNYVKDPLGHETFYNYPASAPYNGNLLSVKDARGYMTTYAYWPGGLVKQKTDAENRVTKYTYDQWGNPYQTTVVKNAGLSFVTTTVYSQDGLLTQRTDARSRVMNFTYDAWGRLTQKAYPTSGRTSVVLTLDANGRITQAIDATGTRTFNVFDSWGRCKSMNDPMAGSNNPLLASYDGEGSLLSQKDVTGRTISYGYDAVNRLLTVSDDGNATQAIYAYDPDGNKQTLAMPNGTLATWAYTSGRLTGVTHTSNNGSNLIASYLTDSTSFDDAGRLLRFTDNTNDVTAFGYDEVNNLLSEARVGSLNYSGAYTYDKTNLRKTAITITNGNTDHNGAYAYDGAGWLSQVVDSATSLTEGYAWYNDGTLSSYPLPGNASVTVLPDYDEDGNLIQLNHVSGGATTTAYQYGYAYDGKRRWKKDYIKSAATWYPCGVACKAGELAELGNTINSSGNTTGTWQTNALYLPGGAGCGAKPIRRRNVGGGDEYHHADLFGVNGVLTDASAAIYSSANNVYDRFGVLRYAGSNTLAATIAIGTPYRYCTDDADGLLQNCGCGEVLSACSLCNATGEKLPLWLITDILKNCLTNVAAGLKIGLAGCDTDYNNCKKSEVECELDRVDCYQAAFVTNHRVTNFCFDQFHKNGGHDYFLPSPKKPGPQPAVV